MAYDRTQLTAEALQTFLTGHPGWKHEGGMLRRTYEAPTFLAGIAFVNKVAHAAEAGGPPPGHRHPLAQGDAGARHA